MDSSPNSDSVTNGIRVQASAQYLPEESDPDRPLHLFVYRITLTNVGDVVAQLQTRHWVIRDANGERKDVRGPGVIGEFPRLDPGESYEYQSRCPLSTTWGTMEGSYRFRDAEGETFDVEVGRFFLVPGARSADLRVS